MLIENGVSLKTDITIKKNNREAAEMQVFEILKLNLYHLYDTASQKSEKRLESDVSEKRSY